MTECWSDIEFFYDVFDKIEEKTPIVHFPWDVIVSYAAWRVEDKYDVQKAS